MVIKNKDGSEYKLSKPNPHMKNQLLWDRFELHNMNFENIKGLIKKNKVEIKEKVEEVEELEELVEQEEELEVVKKEIKEAIKEVKEVIKEVTKEEESSVKKTLIYCLPAKIKFHEDILYGEVKKTINYDKKFKFEAVILNITDVSMDIWTNAIIIEKESILYPQNFDKRWWKVNNISSKFDGNILSCVLSSINPSFEDLQL
jgi:DNA-binding protein YbaB